jgi:hypothetical protein
VDTGNYVMDKHSINSKANYTQAVEEKNTLIQKSKQTRVKKGNKNTITKNYITEH